METLALATALFAFAMTGMGIGLLTGRRLRGSCGGAGDELSCGACPQKKAYVCPSDDPVVAAARIGWPGH